QTIASTGPSTAAANARTDSSEPRSSWSRPGARTSQPAARMAAAASPPRPPEAPVRSTLIANPQPPSTGSGPSSWRRRAGRIHDVPAGGLQVAVELELPVVAGEGDPGPVLADVGLDALAGGHARDQLRVRAAGQ